jgi:8-oxo-dGTP diphosphatase
MINLAGCAVVAFNPQRQILLGKRNKEFGQGLWVLPGGSVEPQEPTDQCVRREAFEEVGLLLKDPKACYHEWLPEKGGLLMLYYTEEVDPSTAELKAAHEFSEIAWFDADELPPEMWASDVRAISHALILQGHFRQTLRDAAAANFTKACVQFIGGTTVTDFPYTGRKVKKG